jgi:tetratricopeptide (TPR) repeat protein
MQNDSNSPGARWLNYFDFELEIGPGHGHQYPVFVVRSPAGEARETMHFPFDELALENRLKDLQIALLRSGGKRRQVLSSEEQAVQNFGRDLFNALFTGEVRSRYDVSQARAWREGTGLRLKLRIQSPELAVLPWEFLYDPRQAEYICLSRHTPVVRYLELPQVIQPLTVAPPLRILGMIASPRDLPTLDIEREKERVERAIKDLRAHGLVDLTWLEGQTWRDLQREMRGGPWHVFHFIGHGGFDRNTDEGLIALVDDGGYTYCLPATQLGRLLSDHYSLRLVLLNSCEGARGSERDIFSSTAAILVRRGIPAVLAMQYEITDRAAIEFARAFYEALADGLPVDAAVVEARKSVSLAVTNTVEWGTPVLYLRTPDGILFQVTRPSLEELQARQKAVEAEQRRQEELEAQRRREEQERVAREDQTHLADRLSRARAAMKGNRWADAFNLLNQLQTEAPEYERETVESLLTQVTQAQEAVRREQRLLELYRRAETHAHREEWPQAIEAFQQVLASNPNYRDAARQLEYAQNQTRWAESYAQGLAHQKARHWQEALATFQTLQGLAGNYKDIKKRIAAIQREMVRQEAAPTPSATQWAKSLWASVRQRAGGQRLWAGIFALLALGLLLGGGYLVAPSLFRPTLTPTPAPTSTLVHAIIPVPIPTSTSTPAPTLTSTPVSIPTSTSTPVPIPTSTSTPVPTPKPPTPTNTPRLPTSTPVPTVPALLSAPELIEPKNGTYVDRGGVLRWGPVKELGPDEYYMVEITFSHDEATWYDGGWVKETTWTVPSYFGPPHSSTGLYNWSVIVMRQTGTDAAGKPIGEPISHKSQIWSFYCPKPLLQSPLPTMHPSPYP